jgi:translation initiation factor IF-1
MPREDFIQMTGEILENLPNATFRVKLEDENELHSNITW